MNIASWFSAYKILAADLQREREAHAETRRKAEEKERQLIDALARTAGKSPVFERPPSTASSVSQSIAIGPSAAAARREEIEREKEALKQPIETRSIGIPEIS